MAVPRKKISRIIEPAHKVAAESLSRDLDSAILRTKLQRPPAAPDILPRARLWDILNEGRQRPLTLISAPAGYGKSTLASRWVAACDRPSGWVSLDESDSDLRMFLTYVLAAIRPLFPETRLQSEVLLGASQLPPASVLAHHLLNDLTQVDEPFILILDDYHLIRGTPVPDLLTELLTHPPQGMHLVLLTRRDPPLPISRLRARGQVTEIRTADLRFTLTEAAAFLSRVLKAPVDDATVALLEGKTEGWATGLRLAALYLQGHEDINRPARELSGSSRHISEYLVSEVLSRQSPELAAYLLETSILDRFCVPLCEAVHSIDIEDPKRKVESGAQQFVDWLIETNLFVIPLDDQAYWLRYHHLFQQLLQTLLCRQRGRDAVAGLHRQASSWFIQNRLIDEAISHALAAGDGLTAARLVEDSRHDCLRSSGWHILERRLACLPEELRKTRPELLMAQIWLSYNKFDHVAVSELVAKARALLGENPGSAMLQGELLFFEGHAFFWGLDDPYSRSHLEKALQLIPEAYTAVRGMVGIYYALSMQKAGSKGAAIQYLQAICDAQDVEPATRVILARIALALIHLLEGELPEVIQDCVHLRALADEDVEARFKGWGWYLAALAHFLRNEPDAVPDLLDHIIANPHLYFHRMTLDSFALRAMSLQTRGDTDGARQGLAAMESFVSQHSAREFRAVAKSCEARLSLMQGDEVQARRSIRLAESHGEELLMMFWAEVPRLTECRVALAENPTRDGREVLDKLQQCERENRKTHNKLRLTEILVLESMAYHRDNCDEEALTVLAEAVDLAEPGGLMYPFLEFGPPMADLLSRLDRGKAGDRFVRRLMEACAAQARQASQDAHTETSAGSAAGTAGAVSVLTPREQELLSLVAEGLSNKEIASKLYIAVETVKSHLQRIYRKLDADGRIAAVKRAEELGISIRD